MGRGLFLPRWRRRRAFGGRLWASLSRGLVESRPLVERERRRMVKSGRTVKTRPGLVETGRSVKARVGLIKPSCSVKACPRLGKPRWTVKAVRRWLERRRTLKALIKPWRSLKRHGLAEPGVACSKNIMFVR